MQAVADNGFVFETKKDSEKLLSGMNVNVHFIHKFWHYIDALLHWCNAFIIL